MSERCPFCGSGAFPGFKYLFLCGFNGDTNSHVNPTKRPAKCYEAEITTLKTQLAEKDQLVGEYERVYLEECEKNQVLHVYLGLTKVHLELAKVHLEDRDRLLGLWRATKILHRHLKGPWFSENDLKIYNSLKAAGELEVKP